jgi:hypothetical protein
VVVARTGGAKLGDRALPGGSVRYEAQTSTLQTHQLALLDDSSAEFDLRKTFKATLGIAVRFWKIELEGDIRWYPASATYTLLATSIPIQITTQQPGQAQVVTERQFRLDFLCHPPGLERQRRAPAPAQRADHVPRWVLRRPLSAQRRGQRSLPESRFRRVSGRSLLHRAAGTLRVDQLGLRAGNGRYDRRRGGLAVTPLPVEVSFTIFNLSFAIGYKFEGVRRRPRRLGRRGVGALRPPRNSARGTGRRGRRARYPMQCWSSSRARGMRRHSSRPTSGPTRCERTRDEVSLRRPRRQGAQLPRGLKP